MAGSTAALSAGAAMAGTVQITQVGNLLTPSTNDINPDLTRDNNSDLPNLNLFQTESGLFSGVTSGVFIYNFSNRAGINSGIGSAVSNVFFGKRFGIASYLFRYTSTVNRSSRLNSNSSVRFYVYPGNSSTFGSSPRNLNSVVPVSFTDASINSGSLTNGFVEVRCFNTSVSVHTVQFVRLIFDDSSTAQPSGVSPDDPDYSEWVNPVTFPEIDIRGNGNSITDGDTTTSLDDDTDFGSSMVGTPVVRSFQIRNTGTADLTVTSAAATAGDFSVGATSGVITPGNNLNLDVTFNPSSSGAKTATITVNSDDGDEAVYTFNVTGVGTGTPAVTPPSPPAIGDPNAAQRTAFSNKIKKLKKQFKKAKTSAKKKKIKAQIKKFKKKLKALG